ncbi:MAG: DUF4384 domain-containing protein [Candidatus Krumholzibacteriota bacterium]|nr:DUF4384 domain-containing protein [Candidatus Krumholzibacteriota bacterium]
MNRKLLLFLLAFIIVPLSVLDASPVEVTRATPARDTVAREDVDVAIRLVGGKGSVLREGRDINLTFRTSRDAYVIIYNIDSEGMIQLLYPEDGRIRRSKGEEVYFLPEKGKGISWEVRGKTGIEYIHAIAVTDADRINGNELLYLAGNRDAAPGEQLRVDIDPFLAFNQIDEMIVDDAQGVAPASDFTYFYINREVDYPRYLCSRCHGEGSIEDPYAQECPEVVIEKMIYEQDPVYPFPPLFSIQHVDDSDDGDYALNYYDDNLSNDWGDYDTYDDSKVYLSIYYTDYDYPYGFYYPQYRSWYAYNYDPWGWDYWDPWYGGGFYFSFGWNDFYYHHIPFYSWYDYRYNYYAWNSWYGYGGFCGYPCYSDYYHRDRRPLYGARDFKKRSIDYAMVTRTNNRRDRIADSRDARRTKTLSPDARIPSGTVRDRTIGGSAVSSRVRDASITGIRPATRTTYDRDVKRQVIHGDARRVRTAGDARTTRRTYDPATTRTRTNTRDRDPAINPNTRGNTIDRRSGGSKERDATRSGSSTTRDRTGSSSNSKSSTTTRKNSSPTRTRSSGTKKTERETSSSVRKSSSSSSSSSSTARSSSSSSSSRSSSSGGSSSRSSSSGGSSGRRR